MTMLKISKQTREVFKAIFPRALRVDEGICDSAPSMQALEAFRRETKNAAFDEAKGAVVGYIHPDYPRLPGEPFASTAIEALKENPNDQ